MTGGEIENVSDTALWVAHYRAVESEKPDALFHDHFAKPLAGERGIEIARALKATAKYTAWTLAVRTFVIDQYIQNLIANGVDTIVNLGAGLDARPYRLSVPENLQWIEVDYPHVIAHKEKILAGEKPLCRLERVPLDLADRARRQALFKDLASRSQDILILTEGVIPYLTEQQTRELAEDLRAHESFRYWIAEYFAPQSYRYLKDPKRMRALRNSPFRFFPADWFGFFEAAGWEAFDVKYLGEESDKLNRPMPGPLLYRLLKPFLNKKIRTAIRRTTGYVLFTPIQTKA